MEKFTFDDRKRIARSRNKLRTYRNFKDSLNTSNYVIKCQNRSNRRALALFRCGCAPIALETGRYQNVPYEERLCTICNSGNIEDEFHCFMSCSAYNDLKALSHLPAITKALPLRPKKYRSVRKSVVWSLRTI